MKYMVFDDPDWDFRTWDYDRDLPIALAKIGPAIDADISPLGTIAYYEQVLALLGEGKDRATALAETQEFFRLFMVPGMGHCRGGPGPDRFDALTALER